MYDRIYPSNLAELFRLAADRYDDSPAFMTRRGKQNWEPLSYRQLYETGLALATALIELGVEARENVGLFADNRKEWILADCAVQLCGAADVPRAADVTDAELTYIVNHARIRIAFIESDRLQKRLLALRDKLPDLQSVILLDEATEPADGVLKLTDLIKRGRDLREKGDREAEKRIEAIEPDDLFTLIYTSGTTGNPKGVMLTHANIVSQLKTIPVHIESSDRILSILPVWHIFERIFEILAISCGACTYYSNIRTLADDLKTVKPTFMGSAPRLWESLHQRILRTIAAAPRARRLLFQAAYSVSRNYHESTLLLNNRKLRMNSTDGRINGIDRNIHHLRRLLLSPLYRASDALVFRKIREGVGGKLKATVSGGGALPGEIDQFFNTIGIPVLEGYGLTETSPVLAVRILESTIIGTVGPPIPQTETRITDVETGEVIFPNPKLPHEGRGVRGEICVRGPQVMKGYYRDKESTEEVLQDGWFRTGDLGMVTFNDCLKILGRCKDTIVLLGGENLEPAPIEMRLCQSPFIDQCMVVGQDKKSIGVLVVPSLEGFQDHGIAAESLDDLLKNPEVEKRIEAEIRDRISGANGFKPFERIRAFRLLPKPFEVGDELTRLFKLKRHVVDEKYKDLIESMFQ